MLRSMGGALAGLAAGLALVPREAHAEVRPTLTSLDRRVTELETAMDIVVDQTMPSLDSLGQRVSTLEADADEIANDIAELQTAMGEVLARLDAAANPPMWSGGANVRAGTLLENSVRTYPLDRVEVDHSASCFTVNPGGAITINVAGQYRFNFWTNQFFTSSIISDNVHEVRLVVNGIVYALTKSMGVNPNYFTAALDQTRALNPGDVVFIELFTTGGEPYCGMLGATLPSALPAGQAMVSPRAGSRLQITRVGD